MPREAEPVPNEEATAHEDHASEETDNGKSELRFCVSHGKRKLALPVFQPSVESEVVGFGIRANGKQASGNPQDI